MSEASEAAAGGESSSTVIRTSVVSWIARAVIRCFSSPTP